MSVFDLLSNPSKGNTPISVSPGKTVKELLSGSDYKGQSRSGPIQGFGDSQYYAGLTNESNPLAIKAANQGFWSEAANSLGQLAVSTGLSTIESLSYTPGINELVNKIGNSDQEYGNVLADWATATNQKFGKEVLPVYNNPQTNDISEWTFENLPSLGSSLGMLIPALGAGKLIGLATKAFTGWGVVQKMMPILAEAQEGSQLSKQYLGTIDTFGAATLSRHIESTMEGKQTYDRVYQDYLDKNPNDEKGAKKAALEGAQETYARNWPLLALDVLQFGTAFKSFKNLSRAANAAESEAKKGITSKLGQAIFQPASEAFEEGYQYVQGEEATRNALIKYGVQKDDYSTLPERLKEYVAGEHSDEFWTSAAWGAIGGGVFDAVTHGLDTSSRNKQKIQDNIIKADLQKQLAICQKDPIRFRELSDQNITTLVLNAIQNRRADDVKNLFSLLKDTKIEGHTEDEMQELKDRATFGQQQLDKYSKLYDEIAPKYTPLITSSILANRSVFDILQRNQVQRNNKYAKVLTDLSSEHNLDASHSILLDAETHLRLLNELSKDKDLKIEGNIISEVKKNLQDTIKLNRDTIKTNSKVEDKINDDNINEKLSKVNISLLASKAELKLLNELRIKQNTVDYSALATKEGQEKVKKGVEEYQKAKSEKEYQSLVDNIKPDSSIVDIAKAKEAATSLEKEKEFNIDYNKKINEFKNSAPKFNPSHIAGSLAARYSKNPLLKEEELKDIGNIIASNGGLPEGITITPDSIQTLANKNPILANKINEYFKANTINTTKKSVTTVETSNSPQNSDDIAQKNKEEKQQIYKPDNNYAWISKGYQFEYNPKTQTFDTSKPNESNIAKKIDWDYLNSGLVPIGDTLNYEHDHNDAWNKDHKKVGNKLFEIVHYDVKGGRHVIGVLTAYDGRRNFQSLEEKQQLINLRNQLGKELLTKPRQGIVKLDTTTKLVKYKSSVPWNTTTFNSPLDVLNPNEELVLGIARTINGQPVLEVNGNPLGKSVSPFTEGAGTSGSVYMLIHNPTNTAEPYYKYKLFTQKLSIQPELLDHVYGQISSLSQENPAKEKEVLDQIEDIVNIKGVTFANGEYHITKGDVNDPTVIDVKPEQLKEVLGELVLQIDINKINTIVNGEPYNHQVAKQGWLVTDLNPNKHFHSTNLEIAPYTGSIVNTVVATGQLETTPSSVTVSSKEPQFLEGAGSTEIELSDPKFSLVEENQGITPLNEQQTREWFAKNLPQVDVSFIDNLIEVNKNGGQKAWGMFKDGVITLFKGAPEGTDYHEAFHAVFNLFLTEKQRQDVLNEGSTEEELAVKFVEYVQNEGRESEGLGYNIRQFFSKLWNAIKSIFTDSISIDGLFNRINTGYYKNSPILDQYKGTQYSIKNKDPFTQARRVDMLNYQFFQFINEYRNTNKLGDISDIDIIRKISDNPNDAINTIYKSVYNGLFKAYKRSVVLKTKKSNINFQEEQSSGYRNRTIKNASADATIAIAVDFNSAGEKLTKSSVLNQNKTYISIDANKLEITNERIIGIVNALNKIKAKTLNIAGNGIYTMKGKYTQEQIDNFTYELLNQVINSPLLENKIDSIRTGGQTGFDEAGAKAAEKLGLITIVLAPKGYTFRNISGQDISNESQFKERFNTGIIPSQNEELRDVLNNLFEIEDGKIVKDGDYLGLAKSNLAKYGITLKQGKLEESYDSDDNESDEELSEDEVKQDAYGVKAIQKNPKDQLTFDVRKLLRQAEKYTYNRDTKQFSQDTVTDDLGFRSFINFDEIDNYLRKNLADIFDVDDMISQMEELRFYRPEVHGIVEKLKKDTKLQSQFFSNYAGTYVPFYIVQNSLVDSFDVPGEKENRFTVFNSNRRSIGRLILDEWNTSLISPIRNHITNTDGTINLTKAKAVNEEFNGLISNFRSTKEMTPELAIKLSDNLSKFGINISPQVFINQFQKTTVKGVSKVQEISPYINALNFLQGANSLSVIIDKITKGINPYQGDSIESSTIKSLTHTIAFTEQNLHQDTVFNVENKQVYSYTLPTFMNKKFNEFLTQEGRDIYLNNWWFKDNKWLNDLNTDSSLRDQFEIGVLDGYKQNDTGSKFFDLTSGELATVDINLFDNNGSKDFAMYRTPILSDSSQAAIIRFKKYTKDEVLDAFYKLALAEKQRIANLIGLEIDIKNLKKNGNQYQFVEIFNEKPDALNNEKIAKETIDSWLQDKQKEEKSRLVYEQVLDTAGNFNQTIDSRRYRVFDKSFNNKFENYFYNTVMAKAMILQLTSIDPSFYKNYNDFTKRNGQIYKYTKMINNKASYNGVFTGETYRTEYLQDEEGPSEEFKKEVRVVLKKLKYSPTDIIAYQSLYNDVNQTDAQSYITIDRYKKIKIGLGEWNDKYEDAYQKIKSGKATNDLGLFLQPLKPFYYNHEQVGDWVIPVQHKNSEIVLIPSLAKNNPKLKKLLKHMNDNDIDTILFNSAVKVGEFEATKFEDLDKEKPYIHTQFNKYWGIQQNVPLHHIDEENLLGTQLKKIITGDIPYSAKFFNGKLDKQGIFDTLHKLLGDNIKESYNELEKEFKDINQIQKILLDVVKERELGASYERALEIVEGKFRLPLFDPIQGKRMQNILNSIIRNNITKQKINGAALVQFSDFGFSDDLKVVVNKETGAVEYMECMLPATTKNKFPRLPDGSVDIDYIKGKVPELLEIFGYRIPTEDKYSMFKMKIVGFTPDAVGSVVVLPKEITKITGSDFDIDKLYVVIPNFEKEGPLKKVSYGKIEDIITKKSLPTIHENNWDNLQNNLFGDQEKSDTFRESRKLYLDKTSVNTSSMWRYLEESSSLSRPPALKAISELAYIAFNRNGIPEFKELENIISNFKDDNSKFLNEFKRILIDNKEHIQDTFKDESKERELKQIKLLNDLLNNHIALLNDKLGKLNQPLLDNPKTVFENQDSKNQITITENKGNIEDIEKKVDKKLTGLHIWNKYDGKELTPDSFIGLCNTTAENAIKALRQIGINAFPYYINIVASSPVGNINIDHYVALVNIDNKQYIYDMPQKEFIKEAVQIKEGFKYIKDYDPRFIELTKENLIKLYGNTEQIADKNIEAILKYKSNNYSVSEYIQDTSIKEKVDNKDYLTKEQRDNAILDIVSEIWSHPSMADQIVIPGGFRTLSKLKESLNEYYGIKENSLNPIFPASDSVFFNRNANGANLIGLAANHNTNHRLAQYTKLALLNDIKFDGKSNGELYNIFDINNNYRISRNLAEFVAAFVDNAKDPVANDLNLNLFTFDTVASIVRTGFGLDTSIKFINQPILRRLVKGYNRLGANEYAERTSFQTLSKKLISIIGEDIKYKIYNLNTNELTNHLTSQSIEKMDKYQAKEQLKVLYTFQLYKDQAQSLAKLVRASRADTLGVGKTMADNKYTLNLINKVVSDKNLINAINFFDGTIPLVQVSNEYGIEKPQNNLLGKYLPFNGQLFTEINNQASTNKNDTLTSDEVNYITNQFISYYVSGFDYFSPKLKQTYINDFPARFNELKQDPKLNQYDLIKFLRYIPVNLDNKVARIEFTSGVSVSNEQREKIKLSWQAMLASDNKDTVKLANNLIKYSFYTTNFGFTYSGFSHLIPLESLEKLKDSKDVLYKDYMYKLMDERDHTLLTTPFLQELYQNQGQKGGERLLQKESLRNITNKATPKINIIPSIIFDKDKAFTLGIMSESKEVEVRGTQYLRVKNGNTFYTYKKIGETDEGNYVFNILPNKGYEDHIVEFNNEEESVMPINKLPEFTQNDYYKVIDDETFNQLESEKDDKLKKADEQLSSVLNQWAASFGIKVQSIEDLKTRTGEKARGIANIFGRLIQISKGTEKVNTLPEEVGHFAEAYLQDNPLHATLMTLIGSTETYKNVVEEYGDIYKNDINKLKREAIGQLIGEAIIRRDEQRRSKTNNIVLQFLEAAWKKFISIFKRADANTLLKDINSVTDYIADSILDRNPSIFKEPKNIKLGESFYQLENNTELDTIENTLKTAIDSIYKKLKIYEAKGSKTFLEGEKKLFDELVEEHGKKTYELGLTKYIQAAADELKEVAGRYNTIKSSLPETIDEKRDQLNSLKAASNYVNGFRKTLDEISKLDGIPKGLIRRARNQASEANKLHSDYIKIGTNLVADVLKGFSSNPTLNIKGALEILEKDISFKERWLDAMAETSDPILGILDNITKDVKEEGRKKTIHQVHDLVLDQKKLEDGGIPSNSFVYERDFNGRITGNIVTEYNQGEYKRQKTAFFDTNPRPKQEDYIGRVKEFKQVTKDWNIKVGKWFRENNQPHADKERIMKEKKEYFLKEFKNKKVALEKYDEWLDQNIKEVWGVDEYGLTKENSYRGELSIPAEKYRSSQYQDIQNNPIMKSYHDNISNLLKTLDAQLPPQYRLNGLMPQLRKDFYERMYFVDQDGKKKLKKPGELGKELRTTLGEAFKKHENDTEFGLTDESGIPINTIPVYFTRPIEDTTNLSIDATSVLAAFVTTVNDFASMSKALGIVEVSKDLLEARKVLSGKTDLVTFWKKDKEKGKPIVKEGKDSKAYGRLEDYINMVYYGQQKLDEKFNGHDVGKIVDQINRYTALNSLAGNIYSGISNITMGTALIRTEAIAGEFYDNSELRKADTIYREGLPGVMGDIGQRISTSKLNLWSEYMNTMQTYDREFKDIEANKNTIFSRLMKESSLFFLNHAGEHFMQLRSSLALAHRLQVKTKEGEIIPFYEGFDIVDGKIQMKEGLTKIGSDKHGSLFRKEEDGKSLTIRDVNRFINRQNFINKRLHGIYNNVDKSAIQKYALGRLGIMFRKYIIPGWNRRFTKLTYNEEGEIYTEGNYRATGRFLKGLAKDMAQLKFSFVKNYNNLTESEKANVWRTMSEVAYVIGAAILAGVLTNLADDDDDNWVLSLAAYESYRLYSELRFYSSPREFWRILKSPAPAIYQFDKIGNFLSVWEWGKEYDRGTYKGMSHFTRGVTDILPLVGTYYKFRTPEEQLRFYTNSGITIF